MTASEKYPCSASRRRFLEPICPQIFPRLPAGSHLSSVMFETLGIYNGKKTFIATDGRVFDTRLNGQMNLTNHLIQP